MKRIFLALALMLCSSLAVLPAIGADGYPRTIVDSSNRTIIIDKQVKRVVPIVAWSYEPLYILGAQDSRLSRAGRSMPIGQDLPSR